MAEILDQEYDLVYMWAGVLTKFQNTVYDTNLSQWVNWISEGFPDTGGQEYPNDVNDWKADSYSWQIEYQDG